MKASNLLFIVCLATAFLLAACSTSRKGYHPKKRKKRDCDCSDWSYVPKHQDTTLALTFSKAMINKTTGAKSSPLS